MTRQPDLAWLHQRQERRVTFSWREDCLPALVIFGGIIALFILI